MPPQFVFDISGIDLNHVIYDQEQIRAANPQRGTMEHLNGIVYAEPSRGEIIGFKDVRADEFWVEGHIPGRPLLPGVLMIEAGAQLASFYTRVFVGWKGFIGFGGCDEDLGLPYGPWIEALAHYVEHAPADVLEAHVERYGGELARLVPALAARAPQAPAPRSSDPEMERYLLFAAVLGLLEQASHVI